MQNELGYAIWGLRAEAGTDLILLKRNIVPEVENLLTDIRLMAQNHKENDYLYMVDWTTNYTILSIINTKTLDIETRIAYIAISLFFENKYKLNTSGIPFLNKAMEFYLRTQTIAKAQNMFSDEIFIDQFQGLSLIQLNLFNPQRGQKRGFVKYLNISEIEEHLINSKIPLNYNKVLFLKEGNSITYLEKTFKEIKPGEAQELPNSPPEWPQMPPPPPSNLTKKIGIILISITIIGTSLFFINKYNVNKPKDLTTIDTAIKTNPPIEVDTPEVDIITPIDPKTSITGREFHIVADGETFGSIAHDNQIKENDLKKINTQIKNFDKLKKGDTVWLEELSSGKKNETTSGINPPPPASNSNKEICKKHFQDMENKKKEIENETDEETLKNLNSEKDNIQEKITSCNCKK